VPPWLLVALKEAGTKEIRGGEHPRILEYHSKTSLGAREDEVPWCASFVCWALDQAGLPHTASAAARSYEDYGEELAAPRLGCIVVMARGGSPVRRRRPGERLSGHVGFWLGARHGKMTLLGGNQSDTVKASDYDVSKVITYRWPPSGD
jgi:uncharacterized protein (TIGR02594 family)